MSFVSRRSFLVSTTGILSALPSLCYGQEIERQPFLTALKQVMETLEALGQPIRLEDRKQLATAGALSNSAELVTEVRRILARYVLLKVSVNPEGRVSVTRGSAPAVLVEGGWTVYCLEVANEGALTAPLQVTSPQALPVFDRTPDWKGTQGRNWERNGPFKQSSPPTLRIAGWISRSSTSHTSLPNSLDCPSSTASFNYTVAITVIAKRSFP